MILASTGITVRSSGSKSKSEWEKCHPMSNQTQLAADVACSCGCIRSYWYNQQEVAILILT